MAQRAADFDNAEKDIIYTMNRSIKELKIKHNVDVKQPIYAKAGGTYSSVIAAVGDTAVLQQNVLGQLFGAKNKKRLKQGLMYKPLPLKC